MPAAPRGASPAQHRDSRPLQRRELAKFQPRPPMRPDHRGCGHRRQHGQHQPQVDCEEPQVHSIHPTLERSDRSIHVRRHCHRIPRSRSGARRYQLPRDGPQHAAAPDCELRTSLDTAARRGTTQCRLESPRFRLTTRRQHSRSAILSTCSLARELHLERGVLFCIGPREHHNHAITVDRAAVEARRLGQHQAGAVVGKRAG